MVRAISLTSFQQDGTIQPEIKLTGILNTYIMDPDEDTHGWGTQVHTGTEHFLSYLLYQRLLCRLASVSLVPSKSRRTLPTDDTALGR